MSIMWKAQVEKIIREAGAILMQHFGKTVLDAIRHIKGTWRVPQIMPRSYYR